jgi:gliding motility-associated-like protein
VFIHSTSLAQDNNVWVVDGIGIGFIMDFNSSPVEVIPIDDVNWKTNFREKPRNDKVTVVGDDGKLQYYTRIRDRALKIIVYNSKQEPIWEIESPLGLDMKFNNCHILKNNDTLELIAQVFVDDDLVNSSLVYRLIKLKYSLSTKLLLSEDLIDNYQYASHEFEIGSTNLDSLSGSVMFHRKEDEIYFIYSVYDSIKYARLTNDNVLQPLQAFKTGVLFDPYDGGYEAHKGYNFNSKFDLLHLRHATYDLDVAGHLAVHARDYKTIQFNATSGFSGLRPIYQNREGKTVISYRYKEVLTDVTSSPNDEFSYMLITKYRGESYELVKFKDDLEIDRITLPSSYIQSRLGPDGKIYLFPIAVEKNKGEIGYIGVIENPNNAGSIEFNQLTKYNLNSFSDPAVRLYSVLTIPTYDQPHKVVKFTADTTCSGIYAAFTNLTDSTHFERYRFYFGDGDSAEIDDANNLVIAGKDNLPNPDNWGVLHRYAAAGTYTAKIRAFNKAGGWVWYSHEVVVLEGSVPKFSVADTIGCQWIAYEIQDLSRVVNKGKDITYHWTFGDGTDSTELNPRTNTRQYKTYSESGNYKIQLTIDDGYCIDSFSLDNNVEILDAPQPGIVAAPLEGCEPVVVDVAYEHSDATDSIAYTWGDGVRSSGATGTEQHTYQIYPTYLTTQKFPLIQYLYGPTGCITTDTAEITVHPGFYSADLPYVSLVSVAESQAIEVTWDSFPGATEYLLYRNGVIVDTTSNFRYIDDTQEIAKARNEYIVRATNVCFEETESSNLGTNILLTGKGSEDNTISVVEWTPYQDWEKGVNSYALEVQNEDKSFTEIYRGGSGEAKTYEDNTFLASALAGFSAYKCYRIAAYENENLEQVSYSNVACVPYTPIIFLPTAFSPNGDNLNDVYRPVAFGIEHYEMQIYNRYGQQIAELDQTSAGWGATEAPQGAYMVIIRAKGTDNEWYNLKQTVTVVR